MGLPMGLLQDARSLDGSEGARVEPTRVVALGYSARALIHPAQVAPAHGGLAPAATDLERARAVMALAQGGGAQRLAGQMIDRPVLLAAQRLLHRAAV